MAATGGGFSPAACGSHHRWRFTSSVSDFNWPIRSWMRRRSISAFSHPVPLVPMPPPRREGNSEGLPVLPPGILTGADQPESYPSLCRSTGRENIQNDHGTIHDLGIQRVFQVAQLRRGKLIIANHAGSPKSPDALPHLINFSFPR